MRRFIHTAVFLSFFSLFVVPSPVLSALGDTVVSVDVAETAGVAGTSVPITFGHVFAVGDVPAGATLEGRYRAGESVPLQVDAKATHDEDGSLRHAVITVRLPTISSAGIERIDLVEVTTPAGASSNVVIGDIPASFDAVVSIVLDGVTYTASARDALLADSSSRWLEGSLVTEWVVNSPLSTGAGASTEHHPHLTVRFNVRAYAGWERVRVGVVVENTQVYIPEPRNFTYDVNIRVGDATVYSQTDLEHYRRARWRQVFWWGKEPKLESYYDKAYLLATGAVPNYDQSISISEAALANEAGAVYTPMDNVSMQDYMPGAGADSAIGPLPRWAAIYLLSMDSRAKASVLANGMAGGSYSMHYRDHVTGLPLSLDARTQSNGSLDSFAACTATAVGEELCWGPYTPDSAHQPAAAYLPYLISGDEFYLEEMMFWATYNFLVPGYDVREGSKGLLWTGQVRSQAWNMRTLGQTAYITPDSHPLKLYFVDKLDNNLVDYHARYITTTANNIGAIYGSYLQLGPDSRLDEEEYTGTARPWMDDFFTWSMGYLVELGFDDALPLLEWKAQYPVGRMTDPESCWLFGAVYSEKWGVGYGGNPDNWYGSLGEVYQKTWGDQVYNGKRLDSLTCGSQDMADWMTTKDDSGYTYQVGDMYVYSNINNASTGYPANMQPALAVAVDQSSLNDASLSLAWDRLANANTYPDYTANPQFAIVPRVSVGEVGEPAPSVVITAVPTTVTAGESVTINWSSVDASSCMASGSDSWTGSQSLSGSLPIDAITEEVSFTLECTGAGGTTSRTATVTIDDGSGGGSSGLVMHWDFDGIVDKVVNDASGTGNVGGTTQVPTLVSGIIGQALHFEKDNRDKVATAIVDFPTSEGSVALWVRSTATQGGSTLFSYTDADRENTYFRINGVNDLDIVVGRQFFGKTGVSVGDGDWHHLVVSWSQRNGVLILYKDGVEAFRAADVARANNLPSNGYLNVGVYAERWSTDWAGWAFTGDLDELKVYSRFVSADEAVWLASAIPLADSSAPASPSSFSAMVVSQQESYLSWDVASDDAFVAGYHVYRDGTLIATTGLTGLIDRGMTPGATHSYAVRAFDGADRLSTSVSANLTAPSSGTMLDHLPAGHWYEVFNSSLVEHAGRRPDIMEAWNGGAYDTKRDRLVVWGGGHGNYWGNDMYAFDVNALTWVTVAQTTPHSAVFDYLGGDEYPDNTPSSRHTYDGLEYIPPPVDRLFTSGGSTWKTGDCNGGTWLFDFGAATPVEGWQNIAQDKAGCAQVSAYDSLTGHVLYTSGTSIVSFNPDNLTDPWTTLYNGVDFSFYYTAALDPERRKYVVVGGNDFGKTGQTLSFSLPDNFSEGTVTGGQLVTTGANEIEKSDGIGLEYDLVSDRFVGWNGSEQLYTLNMDTATWARHAAAATNLVIPSSPEKNGTWGRFRYIPSKNAFVVVNRIDGNVFFYKLSPGSGSTDSYPTLDFSVSSTSVESGGTVTLTWSSTNTTSCEASGAWSGTQNTDNSQGVSTGSILEDSQFVLSCTGSGGDITKTVNVTVGTPPSPPTLDFNVSSTSVALGEAVTLTWSSTNTTSCEASGAWSGMQEVTDSLLTDSLQQDSQFVLSCTGTGGVITKTVDVTVVISSDPSSGLDPVIEDTRSDSGGGAFSWLLFVMLVLLARVNSLGTSALVSKR